VAEKKKWQAAEAAKKQAEDAKKKGK